MWGLSRVYRTRHDQLCLDVLIVDWTMIKRSWNGIIRLIILDQIVQLQIGPLLIPMSGDVQLKSRVAARTLFACRFHPTLQVLHKTSPVFPVLQHCQIHLQPEEQDEPNNEAVRLVHSVMRCGANGMKKHAADHDLKPVEKSVTKYQSTMHKK